MSDAFLSYAREDRAFAEKLANALGKKQLKVWWDRTILPGESFDREIRDALHDASTVVVLWSQHSVKSDWVLDEADHAKRRKKLIPVVIDSVVPPLGFGRIHTEDLKGWAGDADYAGVANVVNAIRRSGRHRQRSSKGIRVLHEAEDSVARLVRIIRRKVRMSFLLALFTLVTTLSMLSLIQAPMSNITLRVWASQVSFQSSDQQLVTDPLDLVELGISGVSVVEVPSADGISASNRYENTPILLRVDTVGERSGSIVLEPVAIREQAWISVRGSIEHDYRLSLDGPMPRIGVQVSGPVMVVVPGQLNTMLDVEGIQVTIYPDSHVTDLDFRAVGGAFALRTPLRVAQLDLTEIVERLDIRDGDMITEISTLDSARLFQNWANEATTIEMEDRIRFVASKGEMRQLSTHSGGVYFVFHGIVSGMRIDKGTESISLMPSLLERFTERPLR